MLDTLVPHIIGGEGGLVRGCSDRRASEELVAAADQASAAPKVVWRSMAVLSAAACGQANCVANGMAAGLTQAPLHARGWTCYPIPVEIACTGAAKTRGQAQMTRYILQ